MRAISNTDRACVVRGLSYEDLARLTGEGHNTIFTLNMMHLRLLARDDGFRESYSQASVVTLDSNFLNRFFLRRGMSVAAGSDLVHFLSATAVLKDRSVLVIGNIGADAARRVMPSRQMRAIRPAWGFIHDSAAVAGIIARAKVIDPDVIFIAVGAPQSEKLALLMRKAGLRRPSILCCGAALEFEAGAQKRSPELLRRGGMEWAWRLATDPRRLARRYLADAAFLLSRFGQMRALAASRTLDIGGLRMEFRQEARGEGAPNPIKA
jgi:N-acetylglucosaminyldiphosphoundecaprenol N-acetyl-beta-D-mannosaminyltransferase